MTMVLRLITLFVFTLVTFQTFAVSVRNLILIDDMLLRSDVFKLVTKTVLDPLLGHIVFVYAHPPVFSVIAALMEIAGPVPGRLFLGETIFGSTVLVLQR